MGARRRGAATYALGAVVRLTGISDHTLRAWERRYGAVEPLRTEGGTRRYTEAHIVRLRLLRRGVEAGHPIGELARLPDAEIERRLSGLHEKPGARLDDLLRPLERLDTVELQRLLGLQLVALGAREFAEGVAIPLLREVGERWRRGELSIAAEHATTAVLRGLLGAMLRHAPARAGDATVVFATPPQELHELGTLIAAVCAQQAGARSIFLGPNLPLEELVNAALESGAGAVALGAAKRARRTLLTEIRKLRGALPASVSVWVGGAAAADLAAPTGVRVIADLDELAEQVALLGERSAAR